MRTSLILLIGLISYVNCAAQNRLDSLGRKQGYWNHYSVRGKLLECGNYIDDIKNGVWKKYSSRGYLTDSGAYISGVKVDVWMYSFDGGDYIGGKYYVNYHQDGGLSITTRLSTSYINRDSTYIRKTLLPSFEKIECVCRDKSKGKFFCTRYLENGEIFKQTEFDDFFDAWEQLETNWK